MSGLKKTITVPVSREVQAALHGLSKAALADCLIDALTCGGDTADALTVAELAEHVNPRLEIRGDRKLPTEDA